MRNRERGLAGVIDTLSAGYATLNRHPWILVVPVLLDFFFWLGPHLSLAPLVQRTFGRVPVPPGLPADVLQVYEETREGLLKAGEGFNLYSLLANHFPGIPSLMSAREGIGSTATVADPWTALVLFFLLPIVGLGLASVYYVGIGHQVRGTDEGTARMQGWIRRTWVRLLAFLLLVVGVTLLVGLPLAVAIFVVGSVSMALLGFMGAFLWVTTLWLQFYLFFAVDAMVISDVGPIRAMRNSVAVVKSNLGSTLGLVLLIWVITLGMPVVWDALGQNPVGIVVGILGNAYISTGLAVASMTFYRDLFNDR